MPNSIGIEFSSSVFRAVSVSENGQVGRAAQMAAGPEGSILEQLVSFAGGLRADLGDFETLGIALPGLIDHAAQKVHFSSHIPEHSDVDLVKEVESAIGIRPRIENDANAAAFGEFHLGAGRGSKNMFYVTLGEGIGGAFIFNDEIWRGAGGFAGEFGYVPINSEGMRLEEVASSSNIIRRTRSRFRQDSTSSLNDLDEEAITLNAIVEAAEKDDDFAQMMLKRTGAYVGSAVATVINLLNVEKIVIGGEIMQAKHLVLDAVIERAHEFSFRGSFDTTSIVEGSLGDNAAAAGVALLAGRA